MMIQNAQADIRSLVDSFVEELTQHIRTAAVEAVQTALLDGGPPARATPQGHAGKKAAKKATAAAKPKGRGRRARRTPAEINAAKTEILSLVRSNPGTAMGDLSRALGEDPTVIRAQITELLEAGQLRKEGERRGTKYYVGNGRAAGKAKTKKKAAGKKKTGRKKTARKGA